MTEEHEQTASDPCTLEMRGEARQAGNTPPRKQLEGDVQNLSLTTNLIR
jgi:hypothetical protein